MGCRRTRAFLLLHPPIMLTLLRRDPLLPLLRRDEKWVGCVTEDPTPGLQLLLLLLFGGSFLSLLGEDDNDKGTEEHDDDGDAPCFPEDARDAAKVVTDDPVTDCHWHCCPHHRCLLPTKRRFSPSE